jgi:hypothetical protein
MTLGPSKYDDLCTYCRRQAQADGALVIILNGKHGNGLACQADLETTQALPDLLEAIARQLRQTFPRS